MKTHRSSSMVLIVLAAVLLSSAGPAVRNGIDQSLFLESKTSVEKALAWIASEQKPGGYWSMKEFPAMTALLLRCFIHARNMGINVQQYDSTVRKGFAYLESCVQKDGGIYVKGYENYNTAISLVAFVASGDRTYDSIIIRANNYLVKSQLSATGIDSLKEYAGGIGYNKAGHSDVNNTSWAAEALYFVKRMEGRDTATLSPEQKKTLKVDEQIYQDLNWKAAIEFISRCQHLPATNKAEWVSGDSINRGGFIYYPNNSKADSTVMVGGKEIPRAYGTASYCGLLFLLLAEVDKKDPRVDAVYAWLRKNYTLSENPGLGQQGLFFYYHLMAKTLRLYDSPTIQVEGKRPVNWRKDLLVKLISLQDSRGFWINSNGRWMENDPALSTAYSVLAIEMMLP